MTGTKEQQEQRFFEVVEYVTSHYNYSDVDIRRVLHIVDTWKDKAYWHCNKKQLDLLNKLVLLYNAPIEVADSDKIIKAGKERLKESK